MQDITRASELILGGGLVAVPTETVYGLACDGLNADAVERIYEVKGRPPIKPISFLVPGPEAMDAYCEEVPRAARALAEKFWPGPLTIVLRAKPLVPSLVRAGGDTVGLRCPDHPLTLALLRACGRPLAGPSANPSGAPSPRTAAEVLGYFDGQIEAVLDGGPCELGIESTVIDMSSLPYRILRRGALCEESLRAALIDGLTVIGITGGTGAGKTTALKLLAERGALTLDCDEIYHRLTRESAALQAELTARFGTVYDGPVLRRKTLGAIVFSDAVALKELGVITHRYMDAELLRLLSDFALRGGSLAAVEAIALVESGLAARCDAVVAVTAPTEARIRRIMAREGITEEYARARIAAQQTDEYYQTNATTTLKNDGTQAAFRAKCAALFDELIDAKQ